MLLEDNIFIPTNVILGMVNPKCPNGYYYDRMLKGCVPTNPIQYAQEVVIPAFRNKQELKQLQQKVCSYLKNKIAGEEKESQQYKQLESDVISLTHNWSLDFLMDSQRGEIQALKDLYRDLCVRGQQ